MKKTALIAGATGLVGRHLLDLLLEDDRYEQVYVLTRKPLPGHPRLQVLQTDFKNLSSFVWPAVNDVFCCLGTTLRAAGSKEAFRAVDLDYPLAIAHGTKRAGATQYLLVSALGADKKSGIFYNRVKGEVEEKIAQAGFSAVHLFRPSLLLGLRHEKRPGEDAAKWVNQWLGLLIPKPYKAIDAGKVARAMMHWAKKETNGISVHESGRLQEY